MIELFRFSPSRVALSYVSLSVLVLALFAVPLWYAWSVNLSTFKEYVRAVRGALADYRCEILTCITEDNQAFESRGGGDAGK